MTSIRIVIQITAISCLAVASYAPSPPKNLIKFVAKFSNCLADQQTSIASQYTQRCYCNVNARTAILKGTDEFKTRAESKLLN